MFTLTYRFEELALLLDGPLGAARVDGSATIEFTDDCEWTIESVTLDASGFRAGRRIEGTIDIPHGTIWWEHVTAALMKRSEAIDERVTLALMDEGVRLPDPYRDHGLGKVHLGVGRVL